MKNTDAMILEAVEGAINRANDAGENWSEWVDTTLESIGETLHEDQEFRRDHDTIARLADGREIYCEASSSGELKFTNLVRDYSVSVDDIGASIVRARNFSEAIRKAKIWLASGEWESDDPVTLCVYGADGQAHIDIFPQSGIVCK
jgi:hypothetical protein